MAESLAKGHEQSGRRPFIVVQSNDFNEYLSTALVVPTSTQAGDAPFRVPVRIKGHRTLALPEQVRALDVEVRARTIEENLYATGQREAMDQISAALRQLLDLE
jgi:mRNA-degrading endonuclease toxin of MazEF toxin-antitoxin module